MNDDWRNNPKLAGMDRSKLDMLQNLASQGSSKGANEMLPFLMSAAAQGKKGRWGNLPQRHKNLIKW